MKNEQRKNMETIKVGIIGAGWIAHKMAQALAPLKDAEVYAISSRSEQKAQECCISWIT